MYFLGDSNNQDLYILGSILGSPYLGKLLLVVSERIIPLQSPIRHFVLERIHVFDSLVELKIALIYPTTAIVVSISFPLSLHSRKILQ